MWAKHKQTLPGFTIVELLIVIVIIGILAAITVVAYNGIQVRAENTKTTTAISQYANAILSHQSINGTYPITAGASCLGSAATCAQVTDTTAACFGTGRANKNSTFDTVISDTIKTLPQPSTQQMNCGGKNYSGGFYSSTDGKTGGFYYFLKGNQQCPSIGSLRPASRNQLDDTTMCTSLLPIIT